MCFREIDPNIKNPHHRRRPLSLSLDLHWSLSTPSFTLCPSPPSDHLGFAKLALKCAKLRLKDRPDLAKLLLKGCEPLPRRYHRPYAPPDYVEPYPIPQSYWSTPSDSSVVWIAYIGGGVVIFLFCALFVIPYEMDLANPIPYEMELECTTCHTHLEMHPLITDQHATPNPENVIAVIGVTGHFSLGYWIIWDEHIQWSAYLEGKWEFLTSPQGMVVNTADGGCWELYLRELDLARCCGPTILKKLCLKKLCLLEKALLEKALLASIHAPSRMYHLPHTFGNASIDYRSTCDTEPENVIAVIGVTGHFSLVYWIIWDEHIQWSAYLEGKWEFLTSPQGMVVNTADGGCWELYLRELDLDRCCGPTIYMLRQEVEYVHLLRAFPSKIRICFCCDNSPKTFTVLVDLAKPIPYEMELECSTCHTHLEMHPLITDQHATPNPENIIVVIGVTGDFSLGYWIIWDEHIQWSAYLEGKWEFVTSPQGMVVNTADGGCWELYLRELDLARCCGPTM
ncbi:hypothetical protein L1887_27790 [Cichorium endivia]|nr:hypothetical protein L1887_27790 [Cichorium endivia]